MTGNDQDMSEEERARLEDVLYEANIKAISARGREKNPSEKERAVDAALEALGLKRTADE